MVVGVGKVVGDEVLHNLEVHSGLHHLINLHQVRDKTVVTHNLHIILLV